MILAKFSYNAKFYKIIKKPPLFFTATSSVLLCTSGSETLKSKLKWKPHPRQLLKILLHFLLTKNFCAGDRSKHCLFSCCLFSADPADCSLHKSAAWKQWGKVTLRGEQSG
ncbi:rCG21056, partial [Rattus norvegicus]